MVLISYAGLHRANSEVDLEAMDFKGLGYNVVPLPHPLIYNRPEKLDLSYSGLDEFKEPKFKSYGSEDSKQESNIICDKKSDASKENSNDSLVKEQVSEDTSSFVKSSLNVEKEIIFLDKKIEFVKAKNHEKPVKKSFSFDHVQAHCKYHQRERVVYENNYNRVYYNYTTSRTHPNSQRSMVPRAVLMKTGLKPFNTAMTVNTAHPKSTVFSPKPMSRFSKLAQSTVKRPYQSKTVLTNKKFTQTNKTAKAKAVNTASPKAANTARPHSAVVNVVRDNQENVVKASRCWVWRPTKLDSASITLKKHNYIDARGRSKSVMAWYGYNDERNRTLIEAARTMLADSKLPTTFWAEVSTQGELNAGTSTQKGEISQDCIVMLIWKYTSYFDSPSKDVGNGEPKSATDDQKQVQNGPHNENDEKYKSKDDSSPKEVNTAGQHVNTSSH
ncbi:hypothetical protein Tco_0295434 [Tanacetum coccineum]